MSFYVQLPSNSPNPNGRNTTTKYTTIFQDPLPLNPNFKYECGLVESIYTQNWTIPAGFIYYGYLKSTEKIGEKNVPLIAFDKISITFHDADTIENFIERINSRIENSILEKNYNALFQKKLDVLKKNSQATTDGFPSQLYSYLEQNQKTIVDRIKQDMEFIQAPKIFLQENKLFIKFSNKYQSIQFKGRINSILKTLHAKETMISTKIYATKNEVHFENINENEIVHLKSPIFLLGTFYVYTDFIENQFVGNTKAPLLKTIVINYNNSQAISWSHYDNPQYINVDRTQINSIMIDVRDEFGDQVLFEEGSFTVKLHFRIKND